MSPIISAALVASFKKSGAATFTLSPTTRTGAGSLAISGPFTDGSRFRIQGMRVYLVGAKVKTPAANGTGAVTLTISTSGLYTDILRGSVLNFNMLPLSRPFKYNMTASSDGGDSGTTVVIDSIVPSRDYVDPTPFTQWTLTIRQPELLNLTGLRDVKFVWQGTARFNM